MNNSMNQGEQSLQNDYSNQDNSQMGGKNTPSNYESEQRNRLHSDRVEAGQHNPGEDETQYGKIRESESGFDKTERKGEELKDRVNEGFDKAENKVNEWGDKAENKMHEWGDKAENKMDEWSNKADSKVEDADRKMDKAEKKMGKAHEKFAKGYENDGERKMEKAEKKMDKAEDKIQDAHEELGQNRSSYSSESNSGKDNVEDYEKRTGMGSPYSNNPSTGNTGKI